MDKNTKIKIVRVCISLKETVLLNFHLTSGFHEYHEIYRFYGALCKMRSLKRLKIRSENRIKYNILKRYI